jgi:hypothetical protein
VEDAVSTREPTTYDQSGVGQHGGFLLRPAWDLGTSWVDNLAVGIDGRVFFYYQESISIEHWTGFLRR